MGMVDKQHRFAQMVAKLLIFAEQEGYQVTFGYAYRSPKVAEYFGFKKSIHTKRLAIDLNLFRNGKYLTRTEDHQRLGEYWESIGGTWGGRWDDGNHYSLEHNGVK